MKTGMSKQVGFGLVLFVAVIPQLSTAQSQTWEKLIVPGLTYRMEIDLGLPRVIHAYKYVPGSGKVFSRPELAGSQIFVPDDATKGREALTTTVATNGALAGINADFFPWSGDPIGFMVRQGELISLPYQKRASFSWGANYFKAGAIETTLTLQNGTLQKVLDGLNQEVGDNKLALFTSVAATARSTTQGNYALLSTNDTLSPNGTVTAKVDLITPDLTSAPVKQGQMILVGTGNQKSAVASLSIGQEVKFNATSTGADFSKVIHSVGGGPRLVSAGTISVNLASEGLTSTFSTTLHPRTAIGATKDGDMWLVVIDGRQPMSRGTGLDELARVMQRLGCVEAMNLDGGGSSTIALGSLVLNRPSDNGTERAICNSLLLFGDLPTPVSEETYVIKGVPTIAEGTSATYSLIDSKGQRVPLTDVIWAAQGSGWIDQSGVLRTLSPGKAKVSAWVKGKVVSVDVEIGPRDPNSTPPPRP